MTVTLRTIAASAAIIGMLMVGSAVAVGEPVLARGIAVSAALMLANLGLWVLAVRRLFDAALSGRSDAVPAFFIATKMVGIGAIIWGLLQLFPASAVLLGGSVVVSSILLHAAGLAMAQLAVREA